MATSTDVDTVLKHKQKDLMEEAQEIELAKARLQEPGLYWQFPAGRARPWDPLVEANVRT